MALAGVIVGHEQLVQLAREHFMDMETSWTGAKQMEVDGSMAQFITANDKKVSG